MEFIYRCLYFLNICDFITYNLPLYKEYHISTYSGWGEVSFVCSKHFCIAKYCSRLNKLFVSSKNWRNFFSKRCFLHRLHIFMKQTLRMPRQKMKNLAWKHDCKPHGIRQWQMSVVYRTITLRCLLSGVNFHLHVNKLAATDFTRKHKSVVGLKGFTAVSYTHLDVYKRQEFLSCKCKFSNVRLMSTKFLWVWWILSRSIAASACL